MPYAVSPSSTTPVTSYSGSVAMYCSMARTRSSRVVPWALSSMYFASTLRIAAISGESGGASTFWLTNAPSSLRPEPAVPPSTTTPYTRNGLVPAVRVTRA